MRNDGVTLAVASDERPTDVSGPQCSHRNESLSGARAIESMYSRCFSAQPSFHFETSVSLCKSPRRLLPSFSRRTPRSKEVSQLAVGGIEICPPRRDRAGRRTDRIPFLGGAKVTALSTTVMKLLGALAIIASIAAWRTSFVNRLFGGDPNPRELS